MFENRVLRGIFVSTREEVTGGWRKLQNEELHNLYASLNIIRRLRWLSHAARMGKRANVHKISVGKPSGNRPLGKLRRRRKDNIKMDLK
jgi:hypothetical protein